MILAPRYLPRLAATVGLFTRYGLADFARDQGLDSLIPRDDVSLPDASDASNASPELARAFRERLVELGPAYIKLGQVLSSRTDLLPQSYIRELESLQDSVDPLPFSEVVATIERELGARISKLFASIDEEPLGSASLGQVHAAVLRDGRDVVVKVQRPAIRDQLADDLEFFRALAEFLAARTGVGKRVDMIGIVQQMELALADELDYRIEARNGAHFRKSLAEFPRLLAPRVIDGYSTERILTTERIRGLRIDEVSPLTRMEHDFEVLARDLTRAYLKQIIIDGHFHADPHPGNIFVVLPDSLNPPTPSEIVYRVAEDPGAELPDKPDSPIARAEVEARAVARRPPREPDVKLALIDFGMTAQLPPRARDLCSRVLFGLADDQGEEVADSLMQLGEALDDFDRPAFVREVSEVVGRAHRSTITPLQAGGLLHQLIGISFQRGFRLPAEMTLLAKALVHLDVATRSLDHSFDHIATVREYLAELATQRAQKRFNPRQIYRALSESADLIGALPRRIDMITKRLANSEFGTTVDVPQLPTLLEGMRRVANRVFSGLVLAGLLVASAMLLPHRPTLGTIGFTIAAGIGLYMIVSILWTDRHGRATG